MAPTKLPPIVIDEECPVPAPRLRRYGLIKYSAVAGTGKCSECGVDDYEFLLVDRVSPATTQGSTLACWCAKCVARLAAEFFEAIGL